MILEVLILIQLLTLLASRKIHKTDFKKKSKSLISMPSNLKFILKSPDSLFKKSLKASKTNEPSNRQ